LKSASRQAIDRLAQDVEHAAEGLIADRNGDRLFGIENLQPPLHSFGRAHRDAPDRIIADMLHDFAHEGLLPVREDDLERGQEGREVFVLEADVDDGAHGLHHGAIEFFLFAFFHLFPP
jgi:hypothetical protein